MTTLRRLALHPIEGGHRLLAVTLLVSLFVAPGCLARLGDQDLTPRPLVMTSGARLPAGEPERMVEIHDFVLAQLESISCATVRRASRSGAQPVSRSGETGWRTISAPEPNVVSYCMYGGSVLGTPASRGDTRSAFRRYIQDERTHIRPVVGDRDTYPWETLVIQGDTARFQVSRRHQDARTAYTVYAHLHLMHRQGRLWEWLPDAAGAQGYELERAIVQRAVDAWLMGRASFQLHPFPLMDELLFAAEAGQLDAFLLTARADDFPEARAAWLSENPDGLEAYRAWFRSTLGGDPPGLRAGDRR